MTTALELLGLTHLAQFDIGLAPLQGLLVKNGNLQSQHLRVVIGVVVGVLLVRALALTLALVGFGFQVDLVDPAIVSLGDGDVRGGR